MCITVRPDTSITVANLRKARALIADPRHHLCGDFRRSERMCSLNALSLALTGKDYVDITNSQEFHDIHRSLEFRLLNARGNICDRNNRSHAEAMANFDEAIFQASMAGH
jgi:hypothetical protein